MSSKVHMHASSLKAAVSQKSDKIPEKEDTACVRGRAAYLCTTC